MTEDPAVTKAKQLWMQHKPREAMLVLVQRIHELNAQKSQPVPRLFFVGVLMGILFTTIVGGAALWGTRIFFGNDSEHNSRGILAYSTPSESTQVVSPPPPTATSLGFGIQPPTPSENYLKTELRYAADSLIEYPAGSLEIQAVYRPLGIRVLEINDPEDFAQPAIGADFVGVMVKFSCALARCESAPVARTSLLLDDGDYVPGQRYVSPAYPLGIDSMVRGATVEGLLVFEVPQVANITALVLEHDDYPLMIAELPPAQNGYTADFPWTTIDNNSYKPLPGITRELELAGIKVGVLGVYLSWDEDNEIYMVFPLKTNEVLYFESEKDEIELEIWRAIKIVTNWPKELEQVGNIFVALSNPYDQIVGSALIRGEDMRSYLTSRLSEYSFRDRWFVRIP